MLMISVWRILQGIRLFSCIKSWLEKLVGSTSGGSTSISAGAFSFHRARTQRGQGRIRVEPLSFYLNLLCYPFLQARGLQALLLAVLIGVSQMANAIGFLWERRLQTKSSRSRIL